MKKREKQICMSCLDDFDGKEIYWVTKGNHQVLNCSNCMEKNGVVEYIPYVKPRKKKTKEEKLDIK